MWRGSWRRGDRFDIPTAPEQQQPCRREQSVVAQRKEQAVPGGAGPATGATEALQESRDGGGRIDLDDPVEVTDIDAQFQG